MESWPGTKISKYLALNIIIEYNGWHVEIFAVEVGDREYCFKSVLCCFKKLGFNNTLISKTIIKLSKSFLECFFFYLTGLKLVFLRLMFISRNGNAQNLFNFLISSTSFLTRLLMTFPQQTQTEIAVINIRWMRLSSWQSWLWGSQRASRNLKK